MDLSFLATGNTQVLASVSGPIEVRLASELPSRAALEIVVRPLVGIPGRYEDIILSSAGILIFSFTSRNL